MTEKIEELLQTPYWIVDIFPKQVPKDSPGQYFEIEKYLREAGILEYFDRIVCTSMVEEGKPSPQVYLYACDVLQAEPEQVFAVEDAPNGVLSAYRAGLKVIMVPDQAPPDGEISGLLYREAADLSEIIPILEEAEKESDFTSQF